MTFSRRPGARFNRGRVPDGTANPFAIQTAQNGWVWDTAVFTPTGSPPNDYVDHDNFARYVLDMPASATRLDIQAVAASSDRAYVGVYVNGNYYTQATFSGVGTKTVQSVTLPVTNGTTKRIELEEMALVTGLGGQFTIISPTAPSRRLFVYADSIGAGYSGTTFFDGWDVQVRHIVTFGVSIDAAYGRSLALVGGTSGQRTTLAARIASELDGTVSNQVWLALCFNDWGQVPTQWTAASFQTGLDDLVVKINGLKPAATLYLQSAITTGLAGGANSLGSTLQNYRDAVAAVAAAHPGYCVYIDGPTIPVLAGDLVDSIHPSTIGHTKYANYVGGFFGFSKATITADDLKSSFTDTASLSVTNPGFDPSSVASVVFWLEPEISVTQPVAGDGLAVSAVPNLIAGHTEWDVSEATNRPIRKDAQTAAGKRVVRHDGTNDKLRSSAATFSQPVHVFGVIKVLTGSAGRTLWDGLSATTGRFYQNNASTSYGLNAGTARTGTGADFTTAYRAVEIIYNGASSTLIVDGTTIITGLDIGAGNMSGICIGCRGDNNLFSNMDWAVLIGSTSVLTGTPLTQMRDYITNRK